MASELTELLTYLNESGGIPLQITTATSQGQFIIGVIISLCAFFFMFIFIFEKFKPQIITAFAKHKLRKMAKISGRSIIFIKHTSRELFDMSMIDEKTVAKISEAMIKFNGKPFDIFIHSPGGEIFSSIFISRLLKEYPGEIRGIIPVHAMSGGTLLALSCDKIYMNDVSCLGPVDPQLGSLFKFGSSKAWDEVLRIKGKRASDESITFSMMGKQYTKSIRNVISGIIDNKVSKDKKKSFLDLITSGEIEHGFNLTQAQLIDSGLKISPISSDINKVITKIINSKACEGVNYVVLK